MRKIKALLFLFLFAAVITGASAQTVTAVMAFCEDPSQVSVVDGGTGFSVDVYIGMDLKVGYIVSTKSTSAEIELKNNGTIMKLGKNTKFKVESLAGSNTTANSFYLDIGTLRAIAAKITNDQSYTYRTSTAVCGVRGTDFIMETSPGKKDATYVNNGKVDFTALKSGKTVSLTPGTFADVFAPSFAAAKIPASMQKQLFNDLGFKGLKPDKVPGHTQEVKDEGTLEDTGKDNGDKPKDNGPTDTNVDANAGTGDTSTGDNKDAGTQDETGNTGIPGADAFGIKLGTIVMDGVLYNSFVAMPEFKFGDLSMGLYLPITFNGNMFDANDRYKPGGNDEWSFGTDQTEALKIAYDAFVDTILKIKYLGWGDVHDDFFFKVGSIPAMTLGTGVIMKDYANDTDFPTVRNLGFDLGLDFGGFGMQTIVNDVTTFDIVGIRPYVKPFGDLKIGLSAVMDKNPANELVNKVGDPIFVAAGFGFDTPIVKLDNFLELYLYGELSAMTPYFRANDAAHGITAGWDLSTVWDNGLNNYAGEAGVQGTLLGFLDYNVAYKQYQGYFYTGYFDATYDRTRAYKVHQVADYMADPNAAEFTGVTSGIFGQASGKIMDKITFTAGYLFPLRISATGIELGEHDQMIAKVEVEKGLVPSFDLGGAITLIRKEMIVSLINDPANWNFFDYNTQLQGELSYAFSPNVDLAFVFSLVPDGVNETTGLPVMKPAVTLETRVHL